MSVWPEIVPEPSLQGREGVLVSVSIAVEPRLLESLLEVLALLQFPVNPQIYHDAAIVYHYPGDRDETELTTLVEFPAYAGQLGEVRSALASYGFDPAAMQVSSMLAEIHEQSPAEPAPAGAPYVSREWRKRRAAAGV